MEVRLKKQLVTKELLNFFKNLLQKLVCFIAFNAHEFEEYLKEMQTNEPVIHTMYEKMSSLLYNLMIKFLTRSSITELIDEKTKAKQGSNLVSVEISKNQMNLDSIDIGKKSA